MKLFFKRIFGYISEKINPGFSSCSRCRITWNWNKACGHSVHYSPSSAVFAICETCWNETTMEEKFYYYNKIPWVNESDEIKQNVKISILKEYGIDPKNYFREQKLKSILK